MEESWVSFRDAILQAVETSCGWTKPRRDGVREPWWWNGTVNKAVKDKREKWRAWKAGGPKSGYNKAKKIARQAVFTAQDDAEKEKFLRAAENKDGIFKLAKKLKAGNADIVGDKCVRNDAGRISYTDDAKLAAWKEHYEQLLNVEFQSNFPKNVDLKRKSLFKLINHFLFIDVRVLSFIVSNNLLNRTQRVIKCLQENKNIKSYK